ncbi:putative lipoprotein [Flavobacterium daejeonense]|nr:putative lipoprotein [Flavobacterium daejeonense]
MRNTSFFKIILLFVTVVFLASCDKDYNSIGGDLIGDEHFGLESESYNVLSYNQKVGAVQSSNLPVNALGVYEDAVFGTTTASFVTQVVLSSPNPTIDMSLNPLVDNVVLSIPYFSHIDYNAVNEVEGDNTYILDSIYGPETGKIKLSIYESGYFMRDLDPATGFLEAQKYYTNQGSDFDGLKKSTLLNDSIVSQNEEFFFDGNEIRKTTTTKTDGVETKTTSRTAPAMQLALNKSYFQTRIIDAAASGVLVTNDVFKNYFRGLYFKVEKNASYPGRLAMMNFKTGTVTINYKEDYHYTEKDESGNNVDKVKRVLKSIVLNLTGNTVNLLSNSNNTTYETAVTNPNTTSGDEKLYLKGGEGAMAVLDLFDKADVLSYDENGNEVSGANGVSDQLDELRRKDPVTGKKKLVNEANLVFHMDHTVMGANRIPSRVYLYDLTNATTVLDYLYDGTTGTNAKNGLLIYSGLLDKTKTSDYTYKIRITNHIKNLIRNADSTNVKLGVVVTEDINNSAMNKLRTSVVLPDGTPSGTVLSKVPQASVMSPMGVVLHGGNSSVPDDKRLKLEIYYTKPN